ncbi:MAG: hypothetical protein DI535_01165 [Citrobacter freundii]|nr:MAG: hypothetical protein DI535_01165 [Citrobacter freundii]
MKIFLPTLLQVFLLLWCLPASSQTHTPRYLSMISNSNGYYEYLPAGYNSSNFQTYPLIIFIHGYGQLGDGSSSELSKVLWFGLPQVIDQGRFPGSFTVNEQTYRTIVISPQFKSWPTPADISGVLNYVIQHYKVNQNKIYLTGMSMGGGTTWDYAGSSSTAAGKLAAIIPVCGASTPSNNTANVMANAKLPVWATHNNGDPTVPVSNTNLFVQYINTPNPPTPAAKKTIFDKNIHDAWTQTYDPSWTEDGLNIYQWMLQYSRGQIALPVLLTSYNVSVRNTATASVAVTWTTAQEDQNKHFTIERSTNGTDFTILAEVRSTNNPSGGTYEYIDQAPVPGINYYRLSQTDFSGNRELFDVKQVNLTNIVAGKFYLFPNPAVNNLTVRLNDNYSGKLQLRIVSTGGQLMKTLELTKNAGLLQQDITIGSLPAGNYILQVHGDGISHSTTFLKH